MTDQPCPDPEELMTPAEVAKLFRVDPKTVTRWAQAGRLTYYWTLGGHRRYPAAKTRALLRADPEPTATAPFPLDEERDGQ